MENHHRYFLRLGYNGTRYLGWQIQKQGPTVQEVLNEAVSLIFRHTINVVGCGRTDTGVHAREFYAHLDLPERIPAHEFPVLINKLNGFLPKDIAIYGLLPVKHDANARFSALKRTYKYQISTSKDPFHLDSAYAYFSKLNIEAMNESARLLFDYQDFTSFSKLNTQVKTNICKIHQAHWQKEGELLVFTVTADRFLRNMVRALVGTFLDVGREKLTQHGFRAVIESKDRARAGYSVPPHGLYLHTVEYPTDIFL